MLGSVQGGRMNDMWPEEAVRHQGSNVWVADVEHATLVAVLCGHDRGEGTLQLVSGELGKAVELRLGHICVATFAGSFQELEGLLLAQLEFSGALDLVVLAGLMLNHDLTGAVLDPRPVLVVGPDAEGLPTAALMLLRRGHAQLHLDFAGAAVVGLAEYDGSGDNHVAEDELCDGLREASQLHELFHRLYGHGQVARARIDRETLDDVVPQPGQGV